MSAGANAWSTELLINNLTARVDAVAGGGGSVAAGTGIAVSTAGGVSTVSNTGVLSVTAGGGIGVTAGQTPTVSNTGILTLTAGSGISIAGGQFATITAVTPPAPAGALIDAAGGPLTITAAQLSGCLIYSSVQMPSGNTNFTFPSLTQLQAQFGMGPVFINFTIGCLNQYGGPYPPNSGYVTVVTPDTSAWIQMDYPFGSAQGTALSSFATSFSAPSAGLTLASGNMWRGSLYLEPVGTTGATPGRATIASTSSG